MGRLIMPVMADRSPVLRIVTSAARESLEPLGLARRGRSRLWVDDHGWWLGVVEFTPPRTAGSGLHVGAMWLWHDVDHLAFHVSDVPGVGIGSGQPAGTALCFTALALWQGVGQDPAGVRARGRWTGGRCGRGGAERPEVGEDGSVAVGVAVRLGLVRLGPGVRAALGPLARAGGA